MSPAAIAAIMFAFSGGYGPIQTYGNGEMDLTAAEKAFYGTVTRRAAEACGNDGACLESFQGATRSAIEAQRTLGSTMGGSALADNVGLSCDREASLVGVLECYKALGSLSYDQAMSKLGLHRMPVSQLAYSKIRMGMTERDIEYLLGPGEEQVYSSSGGYSSSVYVWRAGRAHIIISFRDREVSARGQVGLFR